MRLGKLELAKLRDVQRVGDHHSGMLGRVWQELHHHGYIESVNKQVTIRVVRLTAKGRKALEEKRP